MPASAHTLTDGDSVCIHTLVHMCKQVGGGLVFIVLSQGRKARVSQQHRWGKGEGGGASSLSSGRG